MRTWVQEGAPRGVLLMKQYRFCEGLDDAVAEPRRGDLPWVLPVLEPHHVLAGRILVLQLGSTRLVTSFFDFFPFLF